MTERDDLGDLQRVLEALEPFLDRLVIIGGWAHRLYRFDDVVLPAYEPIFTTDADVALSRDVAKPNAILDRLRAHGFVEEFRGEDQPPVTHYHLGHRDATFYVEFLTPAGPRRRRAESDTTVIGGVVAQTLPDLDMLMIRPWSVGVTIEDTKFVVQVPNPVSYVVQKLVVMKKRTAQDRAKDILYIHDTLELYGARLDELSQLWRKEIRPVIGVETEAVNSLAGEYFDEITDDVRRAVLVSGPRRLEPEALRLRCEIGLNRIFQEG